MAQFLLALRGDITKDHGDLTPADMQKIIEAYTAWEAKLGPLLKLGQKLTDQGGKVLQPGGDGRGLDVKDGPYVETKEVLGGFYVIEADGYDHAVALCKEHPNFEFGSIEIREIDFMGQPPA